MTSEFVVLLRQGKLHHGLLLAHAYVRHYKFYLVSGLNRTMPEHCHPSHGFYSQAQVVHAVLSMLRDKIIKMNACDIEEQVGQVHYYVGARTVP